mmetsp:Transcript_18042/g.35492  ORF Transcript_18042/g.35492 Transcript_18042/m.35492 type:complete len:238 (+) Transcript_18042:766-1479(+)
MRFFRSMRTRTTLTLRWARSSRPSGRMLASSPLGCSAPTFRSRTLSLGTWPKSTVSPLMTTSPATRISSAPVCVPLVSSRLNLLSTVSPLPCLMSVANVTSVRSGSTASTTSLLSSLLLPSQSTIRFSLRISQPTVRTRPSHSSRRCASPNGSARSQCFSSSTSAISSVISSSMCPSRLLMAPALATLTTMAPRLSPVPRPLRRAPRSSKRCTRPRPPTLLLNTRRLATPILRVAST